MKGVFVVVKRFAAAFCMLLIINNILLPGLVEAKTRRTRNQITGLVLLEHSHRLLIKLSVKPHLHDHILYLTHPNRLVIDFKQTTFTGRLPKPHGPLLKALRVHRYPGARLRLVFDLRHAMHLTFKTTKKSNHQQDLHIRLTSLTKKPSMTQRQDASHFKARVKPPSPRGHHGASKLIPPPVKPRDIVIVIDPGHGGKDPGANGVHGYHEKDVVLGIARKLQHLMNAEPGFHAVLTRRGDYFISLRQRLAIAREYKPDLFVAIHADAYRYNRAHGASVYALSERGATSEAARWLAERENRSELVGGVVLANKDHLLRSVLIDLSQNHTISESLQIGGSVLHQMGKIAHLHHNKVEQAAFVVLKSPDIPSLLVENGFLSNPAEEKHLTSQRYQQLLANAIMQGIKRYFIYNPPRGTLLGLHRNASLHYAVQAGDSLTAIAHRFRVSVSAIRAHNKPLGHGLRVGQVLTIPPDYERK